MATTNFQRWGILAIVTVTIIGTIGGFAVMVLAQQQASENQAKYQKLLGEYRVKKEEYDKKVKVQGDELSAKYYESFKQYSDRVAAFDINSVKEVSTEDLLVGEGEEVSGSTKMAAYYVGWDANGHIFDQSIDTSANKLKSPLPISEGLDKANLIAGWKEGMKGMRIGGVRMLTIPSDKAYGEQGQKDDSGKETIAPNMPLKFVVMAIPAPETIQQPDATELTELYTKMNR